MWKYINSARERQRGGTKIAVEINVNVQFTRKYKQSEVKV